MNRETQSLPWSRSLFLGSLISLTLGVSCERHSRGGSSPLTLSPGEVPAYLLIHSHLILSQFPEKDWNIPITTVLVMDTAQDGGQPEGRNGQSLLGMWATHFPQDTNRRLVPSQVKWFLKIPELSSMNYIGCCQISMPDKKHVLHFLVAKIHETEIAIISGKFSSPLEVYELLSTTFIQADFTDFTLCQTHISFENRNNHVAGHFSYTEKKFF